MVNDSYDCTIRRQPHDGTFASLIRDWDSMKYEVGARQQ